MIRFGMALMEMIEQLTKGFIKATGRQPDNLEKLKIQQEAVQRFKDMNKVVDMQNRPLDPTKPIIGGTQEGAALRSGIMKATGAKPKSVKTENRAGKGKFTKAEYLIQRLKNSIKENPDDEYVQKNFPNMIKELEANPNLAKNENVFRELGGDLPSNQKIIVYDDDTLDFFTKKDPEDMAQGGRAGFKDGMSRRKFMQIMGGLAALPIVGKFFKAGKVATKAAPIVKTPPVPGKPEWFDSLVNKVITEGDDMTRQFATKEREIVHATKIDNDAFVTVTRDLDDGKVRVDINDPTTNVMDDQGNAIVSMEFKPGMADETTKGAKPADEFTVTETDYRNYQDGPDDFITEATENTVTDTKDLTSDLTKVKMYAKGQKKPTIKEMMIQRDRAKTLRQAEENPAEYAADRGPDIDYSDYDDFASGGIARMLGE